MGGNGSAPPWRVVETEVTALLARVDPGQFEAFARLFASRHGRWFVSGQGRSGLIAQMAGMRLMHCGLQVHVVGEASAPAVGPADHMLMVCGSGRTPVSLAFARIAKEAGASLAVVTHQPGSAMAAMADTLLTVPMDGSVQFGGTLFEQACLIVLDTICLRLGSGADAQAAMWARHTNLQ